LITFANKNDIEDMANEIEKRNEAFLTPQSDYRQDKENVNKYKEE
jgi:hypothetical protein